MRSVLLLCSLAACASANSGPTVVVVDFPDEIWTIADMESVQKGAEAWDELGFLYVRKDVDDFPYEGEMERCPRDWSRQHITECAIPVGVTKEDGLLEKTGAIGTSDRASGVITIDSRYTGELLRAIAAHEFGHILLNTSNHLPDGQWGIMQSHTSWYVRPTEWDYRLACDATGICAD